MRVPCAACFAHVLAHVQTEAQAGPALNEHPDDKQTAKQKQVGITFDQLRACEQVLLHRQAAADCGLANAAKASYAAVQDEQNALTAMCQAMQTMTTSLKAARDAELMLHHTICNVPSIQALSQGISVKEHLAKHANTVHAQNLKKLYAAAESAEQSVQVAHLGMQRCEQLLQRASLAAGFQIMSYDVIKGLLDKHTELACLAERQCSLLTQQQAAEEKRLAAGNAAQNVWFYISWHLFLSTHAFCWADKSHTVAEHSHSN